MKVTLKRFSLNGFLSTNSKFRKVELDVFRRCKLNWTTQESSSYTWLRHWIYWSCHTIGSRTLESKDIFRL